MVWSGQLNGWRQEGELQRGHRHRRQGDQSVSSQQSMVPPRGHIWVPSSRWDFLGSEWRAPELGTTGPFRKLCASRSHPKKEATGTKVHPFLFVIKEATNSVPPSSQRKTTQHSYTGEEEEAWVTVGFSRGRLLHVACFLQAQKGAGSPGRAIQRQHAQFSGWKWARAAFPQPHGGIGPPVIWRRALGLPPGQPGPSDQVTEGHAPPGGPSPQPGLEGPALQTQVGYTICKAGAPMGTLGCDAR